MCGFEEGGAKKGVRVEVPDDDNTLFGGDFYIQQRGI